MEFTLILLLLYAAQCIVGLPRGCVLFVRPFGSVIRAAGPGWFLLHPRPSARSLVGMRLPLTMRGGSLHARGAGSWWGEGATWVEGPRFDAAAMEKLALRGRVVRSGGERWARGVTAAHAAHLAEKLECLRGESDPSLKSRLHSWLASSLDLDALRAALERVDHETRWLAPVLDVYALMAMVVLPLVVAFYGAEPVLWRALPAFGVLHVAALVAFALAHRRFAPGRGGELAESLLATCFYPPLLLRSCNDFALEVALRFHPAAVACAALPPPQALTFLRGEVLRCRVAACDEGDWLAPLEVAALRALTRAMGESSATLFATPVRQDTSATGFCAACHVEYRRSTGRCTDCGGELRAFEI